MASKGSGAPSLYRRILGDAFQNLPPVLRHFHDLPDGGTAQGVLHVTRGAGWLRNRLADRIRLPPAGERVSVRLEVRPEGDRERWNRCFDGHKIQTLQWRRQERLIEAVGPVRLGFHVQGHATGIRMRCERCWVFRLPLPAILSPRVIATVVGHERSWTVDVQVEAPLLGLLVRYDGEMTPLC